MKNEILISFIIVNYNGEKYLPRLIHSLQKQTNKSYEIIIIDNKSTDNSVKKIRRQFPQIQIILSANIGYGRGCNLGAQNAGGKYLVFLNPDNYLDPNYINDFVNIYRQKKLQSSEAIGCMNCKIVGYNSRISKKSIASGSIIDIFGNPRQSSSAKKNEDSFHVMGTGLFIEKKVFDRIGGFNPNFFLYGEEIDLCWRLKTQGYRNIFTDKTVLYHLGGASFGRNRPYQIALMVYGCFLGAFTNYQALTLFFLLPLYFLYLFLLFILLPLTKNFNLKYNFEFCRVFCQFIADYPEIIKFRRFVQKNRTTGDLKLLPYISFIPTIFTRISR